jgi:hypothetical protein
MYERVIGGVGHFCGRGISNNPLRHTNGQKAGVNRKLCLPFFLYKFFYRQYNVVKVPPPNSHIKEEKIE